jgi:threonyl-tRNA synthetase
LMVDKICNCFFFELIFKDLKGYYRILFLKFNSS